MKALRIDDYGNFSAARLDDVPVPQPGVDEVLIRVAAASLNPLDLKLAGGLMKGIFPLAFPYTMGTDVAGIVEAAGPLATRWRRGMRVAGRANPTRGGAFAEFVRVAATQVAAVPDEVTLEDAAALPTAAATAWQALFDVARLAPGQQLLVHAGVGGVGSFAIQLGKLAGARVIATASGDGVAIAQALGADQVIDYRATRFADQVADIDVVLDSIGGETQMLSLGVLRKGGCLVSLATLPDPEKAAALGVRATRMSLEAGGSRLELLASLCAEGRLRVLTDGTFGLTDAQAGLARTATGRARGKVIITT